MPENSFHADLQVAQQALHQLREEVEAGFFFIKNACTDPATDRLCSDKLDDWQRVSYELAFASAEIAAADSLLSQAAAEAAELSSSPFGVRVSLAHAALTFTATLARLLLLADESGLSASALFGLSQEPKLRALLNLYAGAGSLAALGSEIAVDQRRRLPSVLSEEKELVRATFERFSDDIVAPLAEEIHRQDLDIPDEILQPAAELGCFGTCIPERFGGLQPDDAADSLSMIVVTEELSRGSLGAAGSLITRPEIAARALLAGGTPAQQSRWLPRLAAGKTLCAISITEPNTGSDVAAVTLRATKTRGGWHLNGAKTWCTFAGRSELLVVLARTEADKSLGYRGLSLFLVEKPAFSGHDFVVTQTEGDQKGALTGRAIATLGYRGMHSFELAFDDFFVSDESVVGGDAGLGKGFYYTMAGFAGGRIQTAARATGLMQAAFEKALSYANDRSTFGTPLAGYQLTQIKLATMFATIAASRQFSYDVAALMDTGGGQMEASLVKLFSCRAAEILTREAMQIHGGMGYAEEVDVSRYFVDARVLSIFEGAEEVLALKVIARELIAKAVGR